MARSAHYLILRTEAVTAVACHELSTIIHGLGVDFSTGPISVC